MNESQLVRLQKVIADRGIASRREAEKLITGGSVKVDGKVVTELGTKVDPLLQLIEVDEQAINDRNREKIVIALWKPVSYVTSTKKTSVDPNIVLDLLPESLKNLYPVGRLDKDSSGLLILTNDGDLAFRLAHPSHGHSKTYQVLLQKPAPESSLEKIRKGDVKILGQRILPAEVTKLGGSRIEIVLREGKNRQIRRIFRALDNGVKKLRRVGIGSLRLEKLGVKEGGWIKLTPHEIKCLQED